MSKASEKEKHDLWHYSRLALAEQVLGMFESGLSSALVFFAPRRMGKTEFLRKDIMPLAEKKGWVVFYFSFLDVGDFADKEFVEALMKFSEKVSVIEKAKSVMSRVKKVSVIEFHENEKIKQNTKDILADLCAQYNVLLLMDEVQVLSKNATNEPFVAGLRTVLDMHKDSIKVIFTGSSQAGLRRMFSKANAPFFHFGQNLIFPELPRGFTDHLANVLASVTNRHLDKEALWEAFLKMQKVPQLARSLVERLALNPNVTLNTACDELLEDIYADRTYEEIWEKSAILPRLVLKEIAMSRQGLFSEETRKRLASVIGIKEFSVSLVQSTLRHLEHQGWIGRVSEKMGEYFIDDPNFKQWLIHKDSTENI